MEIERKYLVNYFPEGFDSFHKKEIIQGYLNRKPTVRVRKSNKVYYMTYKAKPDNTGDTSAIVNEEIEVALDKESFEHLLNKCDNHPISKTRTIIPLGIFENPADGKYELKAEVDVFHDRLEGLYFAEVEFPSIDAANAFVKPDWLGEDVSKNKKYRNGYLSTLDRWE